MAPVEPASDASSSRNLTLPEVIFSCGICQASVSEIYATPESNKGFHSGSGDDDGIVTRLWIAECSHVFCGKHLAGGAAPFHPQGEQPQSPCAQCLQAGDEAPKKLYGIRGLNVGEHDQAIPQTWFQCPPIRLDGAAPGMDAVRFQYMALARYSQKVHTRWKAAEEKHAAAAHGMRDERRQRKQLQYDLSGAKARAISDAAALEKTQTSLRKWEERMPVINSLMAAVTPMANDLREMRLKLTELGFEVPARSYGFGDAPEDGPGEMESSTLRASRHLPAQKVQGSSSSSRKRKRDENEMELDDPGQDATHHTQRMSSRDMMPPPPPQRLDRRGTESNSAAIPRAFVPQHREVYERASKLPTSRHIAQETFARPAQTNRAIPGQVNSWSKSSVRREDIANEWPLREHRYNDGHALVNKPREPFYRAAQYGQAADTPSGPIFGQPAYEPFSASQRVSVQRQHSPSRMSQTNDSFGTNTPRKSQLPTRQPLRPIVDNTNMLQTPTRSSYLNTGPKATASPFRASQPANSSVSSHFFQRETGISYANSTRLPPPRGGDVSHAREWQSQPSDMMALPPKQRELATRVDESSYYSRPQLPSETRSSRAYSSFGQPLPSAALPYGGASAMPRMLPSWQHAHDGPRDAWSQSTFTDRQPTAKSRGRITLPPSSLNQRDFELTDIRGLRGGAPRRAEGYQTHHHPGYNGSSRELFTAGSRRSVRR